MFAKKHLIFACALILLSLFPLQLLAQEERIAMKYEFKHAGEKVGHIYTEITEISTDGNTITKINTRTKIRFKFAFITLFAFDSDEQVWMNDKGVIRYTGKTTIDGDKYETSGRLETNGFHFEWLEEGEPRTIVINKSQYQFTSYDTPNSLFETQKKPLKYKILSFENMDIVEETMTWIGDETLTVEDTPILCHIVRFRNAKSSGTRWIAPDFYDLIIREEGRDKDGAYTIGLAEIETDF